MSEQIGRGFSQISTGETICSLEYNPFQLPIFLTTCAL